VQFVSNIEHGRAPLPWEKVDLLASVLKIPVDRLQAANLAIRSDFRSFVGANASGSASRGRPSRKNTVAAGAVAFAARDSQLQELISRYQTATAESRKRFMKSAMQMLDT
jgi:hypothetical protein